LESKTFKKDSNGKNLQRKRKKFATIEKPKKINRDGSIESLKKTLAENFNKLSKKKKSN